MALTITSVVPDADYLHLTVGGTDFTGATAVRVTAVSNADGSTLIADYSVGFSVTNSTTIRVTTPELFWGEDVTYSLAVTTPAGSVSYANAYVSLRLTLTSVAPRTVATGSSHTFTVTGSGFRGVFPDEVNVSGSAVTGVTVVSGTELRFTWTAGSVGNKRVGVATIGDSTTVLGPSVLATLINVVTPTPLAGAFTIFGVTLDHVVAVSVGGVVLAGADWAHDGPTAINAIAPDGLPGATATITLTWDDGYQESITVDYVGSTLTVEPGGPWVGPVSGGQTITIHGTGFNSGTRVYFGDTPGRILYYDASTIVVVAPPNLGGAPVTVDVRVMGGDGTTVSPGTFEFHPLPPQEPLPRDLQVIPWTPVAASGLAAGISLLWAGSTGRTLMAGEPSIVPAFESGAPSPLLNADSLDLGPGHNNWLVGAQFIQRSRRVNFPFAATAMGAGSAVWGSFANRSIQHWPREYKLAPNLVTTGRFIAWDENGTQIDGATSPVQIHQQTILAIGRGAGEAVLRSDDNGVTWHGVVAPVNGDDLYAGHHQWLTARWLDWPKGIWAVVGDNGSIALSLDDGLTWTVARCEKAIDSPPDSLFFTLTQPADDAFWRDPYGIGDYNLRGIGYDERFDLWVVCGHSRHPWCWWTHPHAHGMIATSADATDRSRASWLRVQLPDAFGWTMADGPTWLNERQDRGDFHQFAEHGALAFDGQVWVACGHTMVETAEYGAQTPNNRDSGLVEYGYVLPFIVYAADPRGPWTLVDLSALLPNMQTAFSGAATTFALGSRSGVSITGVQVMTDADGSSIITITGTNLFPSDMGDLTDVSAYVTVAIGGVTALYQNPWNAEHGLAIDNTIAVFRAPPGGANGDVLVWVNADSSFVASSYVYTETLTGRLNSVTWAAGVFIVCLSAGDILFSVNGREWLYEVVDESRTASFMQAAFNGTYWMLLDAAGGTWIGKPTLGFRPEPQFPDPYLMLESIRPRWLPLYDYILHGDPEQA